MYWNTIVDKVEPYVVKIETPSGHGTGFLCLYNEGHLRGHCDRTPRGGVSRTREGKRRVIRNPRTWRTTEDGA